MNIIVEINKYQAIILEMKMHKKNSRYKKIEDGKLKNYSITNCEDKRNIIAIIDNEPGLVKHLVKIFSKYELSNSNGYLKFENKEGEVYFHRVILEYYSKYDTKLATVFKSEYEVNHKNFNKWDNRLENLEIVTRRGNELHKKGSDYQNEIYMTTKELINIQNERKNKRQYYIIKNEMKEISKNNISILENGDKQNLYSFFDNMYVSFNNVIKCNKVIVPKRCSIKGFWVGLDKKILESICALFKCNYSFEYDGYRARKIIRNNINLLKMYYKNDKFREICHKYNILNITTKQFEYKYLNHLVKREGYIVEINNLIEVYKLINRVFEENYYRFYKNQFCITFDIKTFTMIPKTYTSFKVMYYTELLKRIGVPVTRNVDGKKCSATCVIIPCYTTNMFKTRILPNIKHFLKLDLSIITYSIIAHNDGKDVADKVYKNPILAKKYEKDRITIKDLEEIICSTNIIDKINKYGFIKIKDIREELKIVNDIRAQKGEKHFDITGKDDVFIKRMIRNILTIKQTMKNCEFDYVVMNKKTKEKIENYQKRNNILFCEDLKFNQNERVFVLNKLYVKPENRKSTKKSVSKK